MAYIFAYPGDEAIIHPAYRPLVYDIVNDHATSAYASGIKIKLHIIYTPQGGGTFIGDHYVDLISRKKVYEVLGHPVYRFDISSVLKDYFGYSNSGVHDSVAADYNRECEMMVGVEIANLYTIGTLQEQADELMGTAAVVTVVNAALRHEGFNAHTSGQKHYTMQDFCYYPSVNNSQQWLTDKPQICYTSMEYCESLYLLADYVNAVHFTFLDSANVPLGVATQKLKPLGDFGGGVLLGVHQRIPVGPHNINNTTSWFQYLGVHAVTSAVAVIEVRMVHVYPMGGIAYGYTFMNTPVRKYIMRPHCENFCRIHFMNTLGAIDTVSMPLNGLKVAAKSVKYERANAFPYSRVDKGMQRLSVERTETVTLLADHHDMYDFGESLWLSQLTSSPFCMMQLGGQDEFSMAMVVDDNFKIYTEEDEKPAEVEMVLANKLSIQRL